MQNVNTQHNFVSTIIVYSLWSFFSFVYSLMLLCLRRAGVQFIMVFTWWETFDCTLTRTKTSTELWTETHTALHRASWSWLCTFGTNWQRNYFDEQTGRSLTVGTHTITRNALNCLALVAIRQPMYRNLAVNNNIEIDWCLCAQHADV